MMDYRLRTDGALDDLWEPLWRVPIRLYPEEKSLLRSKPVRRLHYIRHGGASFINSHHTYSRLQHTLGVFALAAHFEPENRVLRAAALLHDTGHAPFSHTFDSIEGVDHHQWTKDIVYSEEIAGILSAAHIQAPDVLAYIEGTRRSLLRNTDGTLHADHLDSWARSAHAGGYLPVPTGELLDGIHDRDGNLQFTPEAGRHAATLIWEEARMHGSPANIGINAMLKKLVGQLIGEGKLDVAALPAMTDAHIEQLLFQEAGTKDAYRKLLTESWRIRVTREPTAAAETAVLRKLYLAMPLVGGVSIAETSPDVGKTIEDLQQMLGTYYVSWE